MSRIDRVIEELQSLFTWIFYLFKMYETIEKMNVVGFNPYSPGFSIYFTKDDTYGCTR